MYCRFCGSGLEDDARFCASCGRAVGDPAGPPLAVVARAAEVPESWGRVAAALRLYSSVIVAQLAVTVAFALLAMALKRDGSAVIGVTVVNEVASLGLAVVGLVAQVRYRGALSERTGARATATAVVVLSAVSLGVAALVLLLGVLAIGASAGRVRDLMAFVGILTALAGCLGIAGFYTFTASLMGLARYLRREDVRKRGALAMGTFGGMLGLGLVTLLMLAARFAPGALLFGLGAAGVGIWTLVVYLMVIRQAAAAAAEGSPADAFD